MHDAVIIGAGPAGLSVAAVLRMAGLTPVVIERADTVGNAWRTHYERLHLHTVRWLSHLPGFRMPREYGKWVPRDKVVEYLDAYAAHHGIRPRLGVEVSRIERIDGGYRVETSGEDVLARRVVVATGYNNQPLIPDWPGRETYTGELLHSKQYRNAQPYRDRDVLVVGTGNTGAEIALELTEGGARRVRMSVRSRPHVVPRAALGLPGQVVSVALRRLPPPLADKIIANNQRTFIGDLSKWGLPKPELGVYSKMLQERRVPILDMGFVPALKAGRIEVVAAVEGFDGDQVLLADGSRIDPDAVIAATGYARALDRLVGHFGVLDEHGRPTVHGPGCHPSAPGLHFIGFSDPISGMFREINHDAWRIGEAIVHDRLDAPSSTARRPGPRGDRLRARARLRLRRLVALA